MSESLPDVAKRLADLTARMAQANPSPPTWELESDREVVGSDDEGRVQVTIRNYEVSSIWIDPAWTNELFGATEPIEAKVKQATNQALKQFLEGELNEAMDSHYGIDGVARELRLLSGDVNAAFGRHLDQIMGEMPR